MHANIFFYCFETQCTNLNVKHFFITYKDFNKKYTSNVFVKDKVYAKISVKFRYLFLLIY